MTITTTALAETAGRMQYTAGLRLLADILDGNALLPAGDEIPLPVDGRLSPVVIYFDGADAAARMTRVASAIGGSWEPNFASGSHGVQFSYRGHVGTIRISLTRYLSSEDTTFPVVAA